MNGSFIPATTWIFLKQLSFQTTNTFIWRLACIVLTLLRTTTSVGAAPASWVLMGLQTPAKTNTTATIPMASRSTLNLVVVLASVSIARSYLTLPLQVIIKGTWLSWKGLTHPLRTVH